MTTTITVPSVAVIRRALTEFSLPAYDDQVLQIQQYIKMLLTWNEKINLTAIRDPLEMLYRHFCESMYAAEAIPMENGRLADIGSGAGFPGLALKVVRPGLQVLLVESNIKKGAFLAEVIRELRLSGAQVLARRYEELGRRWPPSITFVRARSVSSPVFSSGPGRNRLQQNKLFSGLVPATSPKFTTFALGSGANRSPYLIPCGVCS